MTVMLTVPEIIEKIYQRAHKCADDLGVSRPAVSHWKATGLFPARLVPAIVLHARERGVAIDIEDIPATEQMRRRPEVAQ